MIFQYKFDLNDSVSWNIVTISLYFDFEIEKLSNILFKSKINVVIHFRSYSSATATFVLSILNSILSVIPFILGNHLSIVIRMQ